MSARCPELPFLPGYTFNPMIGKTRFPMDPKFDFIGPGVPCLKEKVRPNMLGILTDKYPSVYPRGEVIELPGWISYDKQILRFDAFFQEPLHEFKSGCPFTIRKCKIYFFLEDGTIQVTEPKVENSGIQQGTLISRQRIRFPAPMDCNFYDLVDFNVGREVELYGKVFKITDCDRFTRVFLNRLGVSVCDPLDIPEDPYMAIRKHDRDEAMPRHPNRNRDTLGKFLANDRKILKFYGYWDDQDTEFGVLHNLQIYFFLSDDTIEIKDIYPENSGNDTNPMLMKRSKLPKVYKGLPGPGAHAPYTVLNVLGEGLQTGRYVIDALDCGHEHVEFYQDNDLAIGGVLNCYGRKIVLTDCDPYTKEYYRVKYGVDDFTPLEKPKDRCAPIVITEERELPPWNGYGTYEDSAMNCVTVELKPPTKDLRKFLKYDRVGLDSYVLRFEARMLSKEDLNCDRVFIISYYLSDDTIAVHEIARRNSGFQKSCFFLRQKIPLPGQGVYTSKAPLCYTPQHMFVGAHLIVNSFHFILINADEYCFRYMELNEREFPKSNLCLIMDKVREKLKPIYKNFLGEMDPGETGVISYEKLRNKLCLIMKDDFTEHEMITISRGFTASCQKEKFNRETIRAITLTELKRYLWDDLDRLREYFKKRDVMKLGLLQKHECYTLLKGCRLPIDNELIEKIFKVVKHDQDCNYEYEDLLNFLDRTICPMTDVPPVNIKYELSWLSEREPETGILINWCAFNECLDLESLFKEIPPTSTLELNPLS